MRINGKAVKYHLRAFNLRETAQYAGVPYGWLRRVSTAVATTTNARSDKHVDALCSFLGIEKSMLALNSRQDHALANLNLLMEEYRPDEEPLQAILEAIEKEARQLARFRPPPRRRF